MTSRARSRRDDDERRRPAARGRARPPVVPDQAGPVHRPHGRQRPRGRRRVVHAAQRRDARARRRVRLREDDAVAHAHAAAEADRRHDPLRRPATSRTSSQRELRPIRARAADGLPGSVRLAEPAQARRRRSSARRSSCRACSKADARTRTLELLDRVGLQQRAPVPLPARVLRRPAPAHRHRARPRAGPAARSSSTSRSAPWTCRSRRRSSTCSTTCRTTSGSPTSSSPTTSASCATCPTGSRSCTSGGSWSSRPSEELYTKPIHPYTAALLSAIPIPDPRENRNRSRIVVGGEPPSPVDPPPGCVFNTRCPRARDRCRTRGAPAHRVRPRSHGGLPLPAERGPGRDRRRHAVGRQPGGRRHDDTRARRRARLTLHGH